MVPSEKSAQPTNMEPGASSPSLVRPEEIIQGLFGGSC